MILSNITLYFNVFQVQILFHVITIHVSYMLLCDVLDRKCHIYWITIETLSIWIVSTLNAKYYPSIKTASQVSSAWARMLCHVEVNTAYTYSTDKAWNACQVSKIDPQMFGTYAKAAYHCGRVHAKSLWW